MEQEPGERHEPHVHSSAGGILSVGYGVHRAAVEGHEGVAGQVGDVHGQALGREVRPCI